MDESQIFRIDHYLGKETVQNLLVFRFANGMFEPVWNRRYIDHVQITAAETVGVERRASYYEGAGALRDMVQNHLMQVLTLVAMEPPIAFSAENVRDRKLDALTRYSRSSETGRTTRHAPHGRARDANVIRAQYAAGWLAGTEVPGYREEEGVDPAFDTETYVALRLHLDSWRWAGVPFYIRTGKRLPKRTTEIAIQFRKPPLHIFKRVSPTPICVEPAHRERAARRRDFGAVRGEAAGHPHAARAGDDEFPLRQRVRHAGARGLRDAAAGRDAGRSDTVCATRFRRSLVGADHARARSVEGVERAATFRPTRRANGGRARPTR